jgi:hypothetical protein
MASVDFADPVVGHDFDSGRNLIMTFRSNVPSSCILLPIMTYGEKKHDNELCTICDVLDVVEEIGTGRVRWLGEFFGTQELDASRKLCSFSTRRHSTCRRT